MPDGVVIDPVAKAHNDELLEKWGTAGQNGAGWYYSPTGKLRPLPPKSGRFPPNTSGNPSGKGGDPSILNAVKRRLSRNPNLDGEGQLAALYADMITEALARGCNASDLLEFMRLVDMSRVRADNGQARRIVIANIGPRKLPPRTIEGTAEVKEHAPRAPNGVPRNGTHG